MISRPQQLDLKPSRELQRRRVSSRWLSSESLWAIAAVIGLTVWVVLSGSNDALISACYAVFLLIVGYTWFKFGAADQRSAEFLPNLFAGGFGIRTAAAIMIGIFAKSNVAYDDMYYEQYGREWSDYWHGLSVSKPVEMFPSEHLYSQVVGLQYFFSANNPLVPDLTNAFIGSLIPVVVYGIARRSFGGEAVGRSASIFAVLQTSMIVWSAIAMRDIIIIFFLTLVIKEVIAMVSGLKFFAILRTFLWLAVIYEFRPYVVLFTILAVGIAYSLILSKKALNRILILFGFIALFGAVVLVGGLRTIALSIIQSQTEQLDMTRQVIQYSDPHAYGTNVHFSSPIDILKFLPIALYNFWGGPFLLGYPIKEILVGLNGVVSWYVTYWFGLRGWLKLRGKNLAVVPLVVYCLVGSVLLSVICGNWAECVRLRSMLSVPIELMAGVGWVHRRERLFKPAVNR